MENQLFELTGVVVEGDRRGRTIGFPTANIVPAVDAEEIPGGVYAALANGQPAAVNVGTRPTFAGATPGLVVEVHILDFAGDLYGQTLHVDFVKRLRAEMRFAGASELIAQLTQDVADVRAALSDGPSSD
jgi:riboflavin kinase/FMN adenylyltransferase